MISCWRSRRALVDALSLDASHLFHAIRGDLLTRLGRPDAASQAYRAALTRTDNAAERAFLQHKLSALS